jgi:hypothetical protein
LGAFQTLASTTGDGRKQPVCFAAANNQKRTFGEILWSPEFDPSELAKGQYVDRVLRLPNPAGYRLSDHLPVPLGRSSFYGDRAKARMHSSLRCFG